MKVLNKEGYASILSKLNDGYVGEKSKSNIFDSYYDKTMRLKLCCTSNDFETIEKAAEKYLDDLKRIDIVKNFLKKQQINVSFFSSLEISPQFKKDISLLNGELMEQIRLLNSLNPLSMSVEKNLQHYHAAHSQEKPTLNIKDNLIDDLNKISDILKELKTICSLDLTYYLDQSKQIQAIIAQIEKNEKNTAKLKKAA